MGITIWHRQLLLQFASQKCSQSRIQNQFTSLFKITMTLMRNLQQKFNFEIFKRNSRFVIYAATCVEIVRELWYNRIQNRVQDHQVAQEEPLPLMDLLFFCKSLVAGPRHLFLLGSRK